MREAISLTLRTASRHIILHIFPRLLLNTIILSQDETSEKIIGEWAEKRGIRDQLFIATKVNRAPSNPTTNEDHSRFLRQYTTNFKRGDPSVAQQVMYLGNNSKSLHISVQASLEKLRTTYIDLLYVHWWDYATSIEEVMRSLHALVQAGKVLYLVSHCQ